MTAVDLTGRHTNITVSGTPSLVESGTYFDGASCIFVNDGLTDFAFGSSDFTIELDVKFAADVADRSNALDFIGGQWGWALSCASPFGYDLQFTVASYDLTDGTFGPANTLFGQTPSEWASVAVSYQRSASALRLFVNGVLVRTITATNLYSLHAPRLTLGADGRASGPVLFFKGWLRNLRITKSARYTASYTVATPFPTTSDPEWAQTVLSMPLLDTAAPSGYTVTSITKCEAVSGQFVAYDGSSPRTITGAIPTVLSPGHSIELSLDGGSTWAAATTSGLSWTFSDTITHTADWTVKVRGKSAIGTYGTVLDVPVSFRTWPTVSITSMEKDDGVVGDWATSNGSGPRTVFGGLSRALFPDEILLATFNGGADWVLGTATGVEWAAVDPLFHTASWSIQAKVTSSAFALESAVATVPVTYVPPTPTVLPRGAYTTLLDIIRRFMERTGLPKPAFSIGNTDVQVTQILGLLEEATEELVMRNARGWQVLNREAVFVTKAQEIQGSLSDLAPGFRLVINDTLFNRTTRLPIYGPLMPMERQATKALQTAGPYYRYWIANDQLHFYPIPPAGQTIAFEYSSTACWASSTPPVTYSEYPETDTAVCLFPKPVVIAQLRWRWKKEKGLDYAQDFDSAELLLNAAIAADGTRRVVDMGGTELVARPGIMIPTGSWPIK